VDTVGDAYIVAGFLPLGATSTDEAAVCLELLAAAGEMIRSVEAVSQSTKGGASDSHDLDGLKGDVSVGVGSGIVLGCRIGLAMGDTWAGSMGRLQVVSLAL
jgi:hypothetical protein